MSTRTVHACDVCGATAVLAAEIETGKDDAGLVTKEALDLCAADLATALGLLLQGLSLRRKRAWRAAVLRRSHG